ncbi:MAG TPA: glycosyltransferase [Burkholderiaceae bacterium]|nr:glycosyltransferase [Burkholderiaceae bacterium]
MNRNVAETRDAPAAFAESRPSQDRIDRGPRRSTNPVSSTLRIPSNGTQTPVVAQALALDDLAHRPVIVHCHLRWDFVWQRPQQIFSRLAEHHAVLFVEDPIHDDVGTPELRVTEPHPDVVRVVPVVPQDFERHTDAYCDVVAPMLEAALASHPLMAGRFDGALQWFYSPMTAPAFLGRFGTTGAIYDCMDELANFRFAPPDIGERERHLMRHARLVFTGGHQLYESKSKLHGNVHFYGCGVDVAHYGRARAAETPLPPEVASLPRPILGYFGVIDERVDYDLIARLSREFPNGSIVMVGPFAKIDPETVPRAPNIHWLGQRQYQDLPALVKAFDVCLMPFALNEATQFINPTKTLEYMAAGKPIVSTAVPDVLRLFVPIVDVAHDHDAFVDAAQRAWTAPCADLLAKGIDRAERATWEAIVAAMRGHLIDAFRPARAASAPVGRVGASALALGEE